MGDSHFWTSLLGVKDLFYQHCKKMIGDGKNTRFWEDWWVGDKPLKFSYPRLYLLSFDHNISVANAVAKGWERFSFRRTLLGESLELWNSLKARCEEIQMHGGRDRVKWMLTADRQFTVKSLYDHLIKNDCGYPHKFLWKTKVPTKIKVFLWLMTRKSILTKDNLVRRGWMGNKSCVFCGQDKTIDHLFFTCSAARLVWTLLKCAFNLSATPDSLNGCFGNWIKSFSRIDKKLMLVGIVAMFWTLRKCRNDTIFERKKIHDPMDVIKLMCHWTSDWSILQIKKQDQKMLMVGTRLIEQVASDVYRAS